VIPALEEIDPVGPDEIDEAVLLRDAPGPGAGSEMLQRLRLPDSLEWVAQDGFDEIEDLERNLPIRRDPFPKIF
jgi:hypothetical protein